MRVGVAGCGYWGAKHVRVLSGLDEVDEVVVIEPDDSRRASICADFPAAVPAASLSDAMSLVDAVIVATPARTHAPLTRTLLQEGKAVLVEKPMAMSSADARALGELAEEQDLTLMVGHTFEHHEAVRTLKRVISSGDLGEVRCLNSSRLNLGLYQSDVSVLWDLAPHDVSILNYLLDDVPTSVACWGWANVTDRLEDVAHLDLRYGDRVNAQIQVSWLHPNKVRQITVIGTAGMAVYDDLAEEPVRIHDKGVVGGSTDLGGHVEYWQGGVRTADVDGAEALVAEDRNFLHSIRTGETPLTDARSGLAVTATLEAAERSLREGRPVEVDPALREHRLIPASVS